MLVVLILLGLLTAQASSTGEIAFTVSENLAVGSLIHDFPNKTSNGTNLVYTIVEESNSGYFFMDGFTMRVARSLDLEVVKIQTFYLTLKNNLGNNTRVKIKVRDENEYSPVFQKPLYEFTVSSTAQVSSTIFIGTVSASDSDYSPPTLIYSVLQNPPNLFAMNSADIMINGKFEASRGQFNITIAAFDGMRYGYASAIVTFLTNTTTPPTTPPTTDFEVAYVYKKISVPESALPGYVIWPSNNTDFYRLTDKIETFPKIVPSPVGYDIGRGLVLQRQIDYEEHSQIEVIISSKREGNSTSQNFYIYIIQLEIIDVNDNRPTIQTSTEFARITTNFPANSLVASTRVSDRDSSIQQTFTYSIYTGDPSNLFTIDKYGNVYTTQCLSNAAVGFYMLGVQVNDGAFTSNKSLRVQVYKVSDKGFSNHCGVDCNPVTFSLTSTAGGNVTFTNVEKNGAVLDTTLLQNIVAFPNSTDYSELVTGITAALVNYFEQKFTLLRLNVTELTTVDNYRQRRSTEGFLNANYVFEIKTTDATAENLNPIKKNETITIRESSTFKLQTNPQLSVISDVNECAVEQDLCDGNAYCVVYPNSISYSCQCKDGFEGDGFQCNKLDLLKDDEKIIIAVAVVAGVLLIAVIVMVAVIFVKKSQYIQDLKKANANASAGMPMK